MSRSFSLRVVVRWSIITAALGGMISPAFAQLASVGAHGAGRPSDTGHSGVSSVGGYSAAVSLDLEPARAGLAVPISIAYGGRGVGAAGLGWDVPLSYVRRDRTIARRRPQHRATSEPLGRERVTVTIAGAATEMIPVGAEWLPRGDGPHSVLTEVGDAWELRDASGRVYHFSAPAGLAGKGMWLLDSITATGGENRLELEYAVTPKSFPEVPGPDQPGIVVSGLSIDLVGVRYNTHPTTASCFKDEVRLTYGADTLEPLALTMVDDVPILRRRTLTGVQVKRRASCGGNPAAIRTYVLDYDADPDTGHPRLTSVRFAGRDGTPEADAYLPVARYGYTSATIGGELRFIKGADIALPSDVPGAAPPIARTDDDTSLSSPGGGETRVSFHNLIDMTGDGRADFVFEKTGERLWLATNVPSQPGGDASVFQPSVQLSSAVYDHKPLSQSSSDTERYDIGFGNVNNVWRQVIDINGDGRLDLIDADEEDNTWVVYLNTPGPHYAPVTWVRRSIGVNDVRAALEAAGHEIDGDRVPLARRSTGFDLEQSECWQGHGAGNPPTWWPEGFNNGACWSSLPILDQHKVTGEKTFTEWELRDHNGDGYPDVVFNSSPTRNADFTPPPFSDGGGHHLHVTHAFGPIAAGDNRVLAMFNVVGVRFDVHTDAFAAPIGAVISACGVESMQQASLTSSEVRMECGFDDVNGDGVIDRINGTTATLGAGVANRVSFGPGGRINLPERLRQLNPRAAACTGPAEFDAQQVTVLRDVTGDGIPDFVRERVQALPWSVAIGTGTGFLPFIPIAMPANFAISHTTEHCGGNYSKTISGLYDVDGDGRPEVVHAGHTPTIRLSVFHLEAPALGNPAAGRLTTVDNGYGAITTITYRSAKQDSATRHQVPFPEIVVDSIETTDSHGLGGATSAVRYAYGGAYMVFDPALDEFTMKAYERTVEVRGTGRESWEADSARIEDTHTLPDYNLPPDPERYHRYQIAGRPRAVHTLANGVPRDAWQLLTTDIYTDNRIIGGVDYEWVSQFVTPGSVTGFLDCVDIPWPYNWSTSLGTNAGSAFFPCATRGVTYLKSTEAWEGAAAPPSHLSLETRTEVHAVDNLGRPTYVKYDNDRHVADDDVCVETTYATPFGPDRVLTAVASRRITDCWPGQEATVLASESWRYDGAPAGQVGRGHVTLHTIDRLDATGTAIDSGETFEIGYDSVGNAKLMLSTRADGAERAVTIGYDAFGLVPIESAVVTNTSPTQATATTRDPVTLDELATIDAHGTTWGSEVDGFGRQTRTTVTPAGGALVITSTMGYEGYEVGDPAPRSITTASYADGALDPQVQVVKLDELGRMTEVRGRLGSDYVDEAMIVQRRYDGRGRVAFETDPFPSSQDAETAYGTSYHFATDGTLTCAVRGRGPQPFGVTSDPSTERFPTCFERSYLNHTRQVGVRAADALLPGSPQAGVMRTDTSTAIGRVIARETTQAGQRLELARFSYDRLGNTTALTRYRNPSAAAEPVTWAWTYDSRGRTLSTAEPEAATREMEYDQWGNLVATEWVDASVIPAQTKRVEDHYDALGRVTDHVELVDGTAVPGTTYEWIYDVGQAAPLLPGTFTLGRLTMTRSDIGDMHLNYDALGNVHTRAFVDPDGEAYLQTTEHRVDGALAAFELALPDTGYAAERFEYDYDSAMRLRALTFIGASDSLQVYAAEEIDPFGRIARAAFGDHLTYIADASWTGRRLPKRERVVSDDGSSWTIEHLGFDPVGRELERREDDALTTGPTRTYAYGALGELTETYLDGGLETDVTYDPLGNLRRLDQAGVSDDPNLSYRTVDRDRICRIAYGSPTTTPCNVVYDGIGNITQYVARAGQIRRLDYLPSGAVEQISQSGIHATFRYDGSGAMMELDVAGPATEPRRDRRYGSVERRDYDLGGGPESVIVREVPDAGGGVIARRIGPSGSWIFPFADRRGTRITGDEAGKLWQQTEYRAYGEASTAGVSPGEVEYTPEQWNGGDLLADLGLVHLGARIYDPVIGRFLSRDPLVVPSSSTGANPYGFAGNDPINRSDSTGLNPSLDDDEWKLGICQTAGGADCTGDVLDDASGPVGAIVVTALGVVRWLGSGDDGPDLGPKTLPKDAFNTMHGQALQEIFKARGYNVPGYDFNAWASTGATYDSLKATLDMIKSDMDVDAFNANLDKWARRAQIAGTVVAVVTTAAIGGMLVTGVGLTISFGGGTVAATAGGTAAATGGTLAASGGTAAATGGTAAATSTVTSLAANASRTVLTAGGPLGCMSVCTSPGRDHFVRWGTELRMQIFDQIVQNPNLISARLEQRVIEQWPAIPRLQNVRHVLNAAHRLVQGGVLPDQARSNYALLMRFFGEHH